MLIYVSIETSAVMRGVILLTQGKVDFRRFLELLKATGSTRYEEMQETAGEDETNAERIMVKLYIQGAFLALIFVSAFWNLMTI